MKITILLSVLAVLVISGCTSRTTTETNGRYTSASTGVYSK